jgi:RNA polymerase sigma-70 factor (ECF subfamily)
MGARTHEAEDMAQETFLRLFDYRGRYEPSGKFGNFLFVLARHAWADAGRASSRTPRPAGDVVEAAPDCQRSRPRAEGAGAQAAAGRHVERVDAKLDVERALEALSAKLREVVVLGVLQGMEYADVAEVLGIPVGTVKSRMHLAMRAMREALHGRE